MNKCKCSTESPVNTWTCVMGLCVAYYYVLHTLPKAFPMWPCVSSYRTNLHWVSWTYSRYCKLFSVRRSKSQKVIGSSATVRSSLWCRRCVWHEIGSCRFNTTQTNPKENKLELLLWCAAKTNNLSPSLFMKNKSSQTCTYGSLLEPSQAVISGLIKQLTKWLIITKARRLTSIKTVWGQVPPTASRCCAANHDPWQV